ncbi:hypothetical protein PGTUg99_031499 [Puccinia graminis f. sp. tritici]|uniref:Uncharacterized protein n=1 Tax=Puccinia graminis f. sp. tritici TaxID=56615 RepID=A0A5B0PLQ8_PUCGR|nr:hypothetical protein PGTUg99_031499 [Puccinia graminis f. sp. tritici]
MDASPKPAPHPLPEDILNHQLPVQDIVTMDSGPKSAPQPLKEETLDACFPVQELVAMDASPESAPHPLKEEISDVCLPAQESVAMDAGPKSAPHPLKEEISDVGLPVQESVAMDAGFEPARHADSVRILAHLHGIEAYMASLQGQIEDSIDPMLAKIEDTLDRMNGGNSVAAVIDHITTMEKHFPVSGLKSVIESENGAARVLNNIKFEEKILLSSATIESNEMYQHHYQLLRKLESQVLQSVVSRGMGNCPVWEPSTFFIVAEEAINKDDRIKDLQSKLLKLRIQRYRVEAVVKQVADQVASKQPVTANHAYYPSSSSSNNQTATGNEALRAGGTADSDESTTKDRVGFQ